MNTSKNFTLILLLILFSYASIQSKNKVQERESQDFITSFIDNYGFSPNSRDAHEYHAFILDKTRQTSNGLRRSFAKKWF